MRPIVTRTALLVLPLLVAAAPAVAQQPIPPPPAPAAATMRICVVLDGALTEVEAAYFPATGDTIVLVDGERLTFSEAYPDRSGYAADASWYRAAEDIRFRGRGYAPFGPERVVSPFDLKVATVRGSVPVFVDRGFWGIWPGVLYVPVRPGCEFQPYATG